MKRTEIDMSFANLANEETEIRAKAKEEKQKIAKEQKPKKAKEKRTKFETVVISLMLGTIVALSAGVVVKAVTDENSYYMRTETQQPNGTYYTLVTEKDCVVTEIVGDYITVYYKGDGQYYEFLGDGYYEGQEIICQFTTGMEIVGVKEK